MFQLMLFKYEILILNSFCNAKFYGVNWRIGWITNGIFVKILSIFTYLKQSHFPPNFRRPKFSKTLKNRKNGFQSA